MRKETHLQVKQPVRTFGWPFRVIMPALLYSGLDSTVPRMLAPAGRREG